MANRRMEGFHGNFHNSQYYMPPTDREMAQARPSDDHHHAQMMPFAPDLQQVGSYDYPPQRQDMFGYPSHTDDLPLQSHNSHPGGRMSNTMLAYDPLSSGGSMSMPLEPGNAFSYDTSAFPSSAMGLDHGMDRAHVPHPASLQSQPVNMDPNAAYSAMQTQESYSSTYWAQPHHPPAPEIHPTPSVGIANRISTEVPQSAEPAPARKRPQELQVAPQSSNPASHRFIQPKRPSPVKASSSSSHPKSESTEDSPQFHSIYSSSGFDIMGVLAEVVSRPNPKIDIGAVDLSCAFVLCDITQDDHPIVYVSEAFERLTGYTEGEIVGQNCRFLQGPDGVVQQGMQRTFVDQDTAFRLRSTIEDRTEIQASIINYRKGGQPFMNLITMIPIHWNSSDYRFYVGFQVDLVEKPDAVTSRNPNGSYSINYQRTQLLPNYIVPPPDVFQTQPDLATRFGHDEVTAILERFGSSDPTSKSYLERVLVENTDDVIHVLSFESEFLYLSPSCAKVLEYSPSELVGKTLSTVCHPSDIGPVVRDLRGCTTTDPVSVVYRIRKKYSGYIWFESHGSWHISDCRRQWMVMVGRVRPVYCLDQIAKIGRGGLAENDIWAKISLSGIILFVSSKARVVLGRAPDTLMGKSLQDLMDTRVEAQRALNVSRSGQQTTFSHRIRHKKGHLLPVQTTLYPGDTKEGARPSFLVAQISFPRPSPTAAGTKDPTTTETVQTLPLSQPILDMSDPMGSNRLPAGNEQVATMRGPTFFTELMPTRGSSWQVELRELEKSNKSLSEELQKMLTRKKKRKRKQSAVIVEKSCAMCQTKRTPEWRRGPSGNRDLCNSCGLRWAKQIRNAAQAQTQPQTLVRAGP